MCCTINDSILLCNTVVLVGHDEKTSSDTDAACVATALTLCLNMSSDMMLLVGPLL